MGGPWPKDILLVLLLSQGNFTLSHNFQFEKKKKKKEKKFRLEKFSAEN